MLTKITNMVNSMEDERDDHDQLNVLVDLSYNGLSMKNIRIDHCLIDDRNKLVIEDTNSIDNTIATIDIGLIDSFSEKSVPDGMLYQLHIKDIVFNLLLENQ